MGHAKAPQRVAVKPPRLPTSPRRKEREQEEKKKAFDDYMASLKPRETKEKLVYEHIGSSRINFNSVKMELVLKTQSKKGQLFDVEEKTELLDLIDNIIVGQE